MEEQKQIKSQNKKWKRFFLISILGCLMVMGFLLWYKLFSYYNYSVYTYQTDEITKDPDTGAIYVTKSISNINRYYETVIYNHSSSDITVEIYKNSDEENPVLIQKDILIAGEGEYRFNNGNNAYRIIINGENITEDNIVIEAETVSYLRTYKQAVIITVILAVVMVGVWDILILFVSGSAEKYGEKVNIGIARAAAVGSILSCLILCRGYYETNLCFIALLCAVLALAMKKKSDMTEETS